MVEHCGSRLSFLWLYCIDLIYVFVDIYLGITQLVGDNAYGYKISVIMVSGFFEKMGYHDEQDLGAIAYAQYCIL